MTSLPTFTRSEIESRVHRAIEELRKHDRQLLDVDANERSITHHLAVYLQEEFEGWKVDVEYNRDGHDVKRLRDQSDVSRDNVYPDMIVHKRGTNDDNVLVVEVKKLRCGHDLVDKRKLVEFTKPLKHNGLNYRWGLHLILQSKGPGMDSLRWYERGEQCEE